METPLTSASPLLCHHLNRPLAMLANRLPLLRLLPALSPSKCALSSDACGKCNLKKMTWRARPLIIQQPQRSTMNMIRNRAAFESMLEHEHVCILPQHAFGFVWALCFPSPETCKLGSSKRLRLNWCDGQCEWSPYVLRDGVAISRI